MPNGKAFKEGDRFLRQYNAKQNKANRKRGEDGGGNFFATSAGDLKPSVYLTKHAKVRMAERGVSQKDAIKGTKKAGAIVSPSGAVVTVIPDAWRTSSTGKGEIAAGKRSRDSRSRVGKKATPVPAEDALPDGHALVKVTLAQPNISVGFVLGKKHSRIQEVMANHPGTSYQVDGATISVWGPSTETGRLQRQISLLEQEALEASVMIYGPSLPVGDLPNGHTRRRIVVPELAIGHVFGKAGRNIAKLREEHSPAAFINFDRKTGVMNVWGEAPGVENVCSAVAAVVEVAKKTKARIDARKAKAAEKSREKKMKQHKNDMEAFSKAENRRRGRQTQGVRGAKAIQKCSRVPKESR